MGNCARQRNKRGRDDKHKTTSLSAQFYKKKVFRGWGRVITAFQASVPILHHEIIFKLTTYA